MRYLAHALETGGTLAGTAKGLGVSEPALQAWRKGQPAAHRRAQAPGQHMSSNCIALDAAKNVYVAGSTQSSDFPGAINT